MKSNVQFSVFNSYGSVTVLSSCVVCLCVYVLRVCVSADTATGRRLLGRCAHKELN